MRKSTMICVAIGLAMALTTPIIGMTLTATRTPVAVGILDRESLNVQLLPPLLKRDSWYGGAVIPVRVLVTDQDDGSGVLGAQVTMWVNDNVPGSSPGNVNMGNNFTELGNGVYQFNLDTKPYNAGPGSAPLKIIVMTWAPDERSHALTVFVSLR